jgi:hypothetical protein
MASEWLYLSGIWLLASRFRPAQEGASLVDVNVYDPLRKAARMVGRMGEMVAPYFG